MNDHMEFLQFAHHLDQQVSSIQPLLKTDTPPAPETLAALAHCGILTREPSVIARCSAGGIPPRQLFFCVTAVREDDLRAVHGHCRYLLERQSDIPRLDTLAGPLLADGRLEEVGIRISASGDDAFTKENIPLFARLLRRSANLAVRSVFLPLDAAADPAQQAKEAFSLVKKLRADLPCIFHAFCLEGLSAPLAQDDGALLQTLRMLAALNDTSLYASFFIS